MLRVLSLSTCFPDRGRPWLGNFVERQSLALASRPGVEVELIVPLGLTPLPFSWNARQCALRSLPEAEQWKGLAVHRPRFHRFPGLSALRPPALARRLVPLCAAILERYPFDIVSAEFAWPEGPAALRIARAFAVPLAIKTRGIDFHKWLGNSFTRSALLQALHGADIVLAISVELRDRLIALGLSPERVVLHHNGIDRQLFHLRDRAVAKASLRVQGPLLLCVGNLTPIKRQSLAIDALAQLPGATLLIAGAGPERARLAARARGLGLSDRVRLLGTVPHPLLPAFYAAADMLIHPSSVEGFANVRLEALACGTPVVTTNVGSAHELIDRPEAGRIVEARAEAIAAAAGELLSSPPCPEKVAVAAERFSWEGNAAELERHLRHAAAKQLT
jgi:glycosyltransferase involved in cell wall biosynthesis